MGARAVPAGGFAVRSRAAWVSVPRHDDRGGRCIPGLGQRRRVTPVQTTSQEAWPEADLGDEILPEMRAVVERRQACALQKGARRIARCGGCCPAFAGVPLPSIL